MENLLIILKNRSKIIRLFLGINLLLFLLVSCDKNESEFENALIEFEKYFSKKELDAFKNDPEETAFFTIKDGKNKSFESFFRDNSIGKKIAFFFEKNMIDDYNFMSDVMLICLHRKYHKIPYNLDKLIKKKKWEYNDSYYCKKKRSEKALFLFKLFKQNDTLHLIQPIKEGHIYDINCPNTFINKNDEELINLSGIVVSKKVILDSLYFTCQIKLTSLSIEKFYPMDRDETITVGDTMTIYLNNVYFDYSKHRNFMFSY
jgi:hypothetical protein